jgi:hypothetical protein
VLLHKGKLIQLALEAAIRLRAPSDEEIYAGTSRRARAAFCWFVLTARRCDCGVTQWRPIEH